jgi:hypothetical protein
MKPAQVATTRERIASYVLTYRLDQLLAIGREVVRTGEGTLFYD